MNPPQVYMCSPSWTLLPPLFFFFFFKFWLPSVFTVVHFSCRAGALEYTGSVVAACGLSCPTACGILVPQPGVEPKSPVLPGRFLTTRLPEKPLMAISINGKKGKVLVTQLCPTLCNPIDCSPPGSSVCGIFQAKILDWLPSLSHVWLFATPWTVAYQAPVSMGFSRQ